MMWPESSPSTANYSRQPGVFNGFIYRTTALDLFNHYSDYEAAAKTKLGVAEIEVSGSITGVSKNIFEETEIDFDGGEGTTAVTVTLVPPTKDMEFDVARGGWISVICEDMSQISGKPIGQNCRLRK